MRTFWTSFAAITSARVVRKQSEFVCVLLDFIEQSEFTVKKINK